MAIRDGHFPPLSPNAALRWQIVRKHIERVAPRTILELGTGLGAVASRLAARATYIGVEPDATSRSAAAGRLGDRGRLLADIDLLPADETVDLLCAFEVLEHIDDDVGALTTWVRHVRPGGHVLVSVPAEPDRFGAADELVGHVRRYSRGDLVELFESTGLEAVAMVHYGFPLGNALEAGRNVIARRRLARNSLPSDAATRTAGSGRTLQPPAWAANSIWLVTAPFRLMQERFPDRGPGLVGLGRRPA